MENLVVDQKQIPEQLRCYRGKTVLVTGHTGFKGAWLAYWLHLLGAKVVGFSLAPQPDQLLFEQLKLADLIDHRIGDIRDASAVQKLFEQVKPEFVFHLAAQSLVRLSYDQPVNTFDTNVMGSVNMLEAIRHCSSVRSVIYVTTDKCYKNKEWIWGYRENDELGGKDPYSASKAAAEVVFYSYEQSFFSKQKLINISSVRAGNVIGGGDWALDRIVPDCMRALLQAQPITVRNPQATRPWQHVLDPLYGYLLVGARQHGDESRHLSSSWNFGPEAEANQSVERLVKEVLTHWGSGQVQSPKNMNDAKPEAQLLHLNCDKAKAELAWRPVWNFSTTLAKTVEWYKLHKQQAPSALTRKQILEFMGDII